MNEGPQAGRLARTPRPGVMTIAGIDPGLARTGFGVIRGTDERLEVLESGTIETDASWPVEQRLLVLYRELSGLFSRHSPDLVAVERLFVNRNLRSAMAVGEARGVVLLAAAEARARVVEYTPQAVKLTITGQGQGAKQQVAYMVRHLLALRRPLAPDEGDALALALCGARFSGPDRSNAPGVGRA
ncbi:MAG: crossover junction endodeoxyribonuclease RuvC [Bacillota bacterium]